jgi:hypothetical protein
MNPIEYFSVLVTCPFNKKANVSLQYLTKGGKSEEIHIELESFEKAIEWIEKTAREKFIEGQ